MALGHALVVRALLRGTILASIHYFGRQEKHDKNPQKKYNAFLAILKL